MFKVYRHPVYVLLSTSLCSVFAASGLFTNTNFSTKTTLCYDFLFAATFPRFPLYVFILTDNK
jgi:hypothetical protein